VYDTEAKTLPHSLLFFLSPPKEWKEGLPIGNGALAGMVSGTPACERLALSHEWLWRGKNRNRTIEPRHQHLDAIRKLFFEGKTLEAGELANEKLGGGGGASGKPNRVDPYQPAGDLFIETTYDDVSDYRRELDLDRAVCSVTYSRNGTKFTQEYIAHSGLPVIAMRFSADGPEPFRARLLLDRIDDPECTLTRKAVGNTISLEGRFPEGIRFCVTADVFAEGVAKPEADKAAIVIEAEEALVLLTIAVDLDDGDAASECRAALETLPVKWNELLISHIDRHQSLYRRVVLDIGDDLRGVPTDTRLAALRAGKPDEGLLSTYANFGRYLLIASSQPGGLPANLQGKWNEELNPPWDCDLHQDINIQMNYWLAEVCGLVECIEPLFDHIERFIPGGREIARLLYNCRGVFNCIQTDPSGRPTPESRGWDVWTGAAAWLAQHFWWRYEYSLDEEFLRKAAYPYFKEVAAFYEDYLVEDPRTGYLVPVPSQSPENRFAGGTSPVSLCVAATMDLELIHDLLTHAIEAAGILDVDEELRVKWADILRQLPPLQIGRHGQLQEWFEDYEEIEPGHRHISHLFALYPGDQLTLENEPELTRAARVSLERRLAAEGGHTGWSRAWTVCIWARLCEGEEAHHHLKKLITDFATDSLLDLHPPRIFQIDGNLGGAAGVFEMLLQSHRGSIRILPALPKAWASGSVRGLRARGGFVIDIIWTSGRATNVEIESKGGRTCTLTCANAARAKLLSKKRPIKLRILSDDCIEFETEKGGSYTMELAD